ncbi:CopG family ribbon-helix-helix protein [Aminobacter anthyllidis]|uniref:CopG family ribbon-helix-helix protein n=1 Tax=Aminobacter anthyllidis TaxID=1035067 RepID=A0A9X1AFL9_9HYPH|nr:CopG family ribbon-helix-helix protein [Aminobacter anthyllidis]MBT1158737.1 CopG family ribbon-helix-helix protein [Aminobacter anthyllidis]
MASESKFSISLPDDLRSEVDDYATLTRRSRAFIIKEAVAAYVGDQQAYLASVREAEREADEGNFVPGETVADWLASWGTDSELPAPEAGAPQT